MLYKGDIIIMIFVILIIKYLNINYTLYIITYYGAKRYFF